MTERLFAVSLDEPIASGERELALRRRVYPRRVQGGPMSTEKAARDIACMEAVVATLRASTDRGGVR